MDRSETSPPPYGSEVEPAASSPSGFRAHAITVGLGAGGLVLIVVGTMALTDTSALVRFTLGLAGLACVYMTISRAGQALRGPQFSTATWLSTAWLALVVCAGLFANILPFGESRDVSKTLRTPTLLRPDLFSEHPLGTDRQGLDILGGLAYGARVSLVVGLGAVAIGMLVGGALGMTAAYRRGRLDTGVRLLTDSMLAFPPLILLLGMVAVIGPSVRNVTLALALLGVPTYIRLARANTMLFSEREFVVAARAMGERPRSIMFRDLLPNVALPVLSFGFIMVAVLIVAESSLSFLGLSVQRPTPTWGNMIAAGQADFNEHPHLVFIPGTVLFLTVFSLNLLGDRARKTWTPGGSNA